MDLIDNPVVRCLRPFEDRDLHMVESPTEVVLANFPSTLFDTIRINGSPKGSTSIKMAMGKTDQERHMDRRESL